MIKIIFPENFNPEKKYLTHIIFKEFLGLDYEYIIDNSLTGYKIVLPNGRFIFIEDHFFNKHKDGLSYLNLSSIPPKVKFSNNEFTVKGDVPFIYGNDHIEEKKDNIICGIDIFASVFFMLTRWEEYALTTDNKTLNQNDFFVVKNNIYDRPIVNELIEMLWKMLLYLDFSNIRTPKKHEIILTHDVDHIFPNTIMKLKKILKSPKIFLSDYITRKNPYDTFDFLMNISEKKNSISRFYFMNSISSPRDARYNIQHPFVKKMINHIKERGHVVGFHPSLETFDNAEKWKLEKDSLEQTLNAQVNEGRQHYLRFKAPFTWQIWEDNNMLFDSTVGFNKLVGFRCGTGDSFSIFNFLTRKKLNLKELPLVVMEGALKSMTKTSNDYLAALNKYRDISRCYNMKYTVLFHNSSFDPVFWKGWKDVYLNFCGVDNG